MKHEPVCLMPRTLDRLYEIGGVVPGDPAECWEWRGTRNRDGYGRFGTSSRAHREALQIVLGRELTKGENALHSCDNPPCVNVSHLRAGSQGDNLRDAVARGRRDQRAILDKLRTPENVAKTVEAAARARRARTHCANGHEWTPENTRRNKKGARVCLLCTREQAARYRAKVKKRRD